jgi:hypothetical protein
MRGSILILWVLLAVRAAFAQGVVMEVERAAGAHVKRYHSIPLYVTLLNPGPPLDARIVVDVLDYAQRPRCTVEQAVSLPTGTRKRIAMLVPEMMGYSFSNTPFAIRLVDGAGHKIAEPIHNAGYPQTANDGPLVLVVSPHRSGHYNYLSSYKNQFKPAGAVSPTSSTSTIYLDDIEPSAVPEHWAGLSSADIVVVGDAQALHLAPAQVQALLDYAAAGGDLILVSNGDPAQFNATGFGPALPARPTGTVALSRVSGVTAAQRRDFDAPDPVLLASTPVAGARVLRQVGSLPTLVARPWGLGAVYLSAVDLGNAHTLSDNGLRAVWTRIWDDMQKREKMKIEPSIYDPLGSPPEMTPPSLGFLLLFMVVYIAIVGPLNYVLLRRRDRMLWTWLTVPVLAAGFTIVSYCISYGAKGSEIVAREFALVKMRSGAAQASADVYLSVFSPRRAGYDLRLPGRTVFRSTIGEELARWTLGWDDGSVLRGLEVPMWSMRRMYAQAVTSLDGPIRLQLDRPAGDRLKGEIINDSGLDLSDCRLLLHGTVSAPLSLKPGTNVIDATLRRCASQDAMTEALMPGGMSGSGMTSTIRRASASLSEVVMNMDTPILVAWPRASVAPLELTPAAARHESVEMLVVW